MLTILPFGVICVRDSRWLAWISLSVYCYGGRGRVCAVFVEAFAVIPCWHFPVPHSLAAASGASPSSISPAYGDTV